MSFIKEKLAQQKLVKVLNTFKKCIELQDEQIRILNDTLYKTWQELLELKEKVKELEKKF